MSADQEVKGVCIYIEEGGGGLVIWGRQGKKDRHFQANEVFLGL